MTSGSSCGLKRPNKCVIIKPEDISIGGQVIHDKYSILELENINLNDWKINNGI